MLALARATAIVGGLVLTALIVLVCLSVAGRGGNTLAHAPWLREVAPGLAEALLASGVGPINGDFELVEAGIAFVVFACLPLCQITGAHATVDVFTARLPRPLVRAIVAFWEIVLAGLIVLIAWQLAQGMLGKMRVGETTYLIEFPVWWAYAASLAAALVAVVVALWCAAARVVALVSGADHLPRPEGAVH